jgi:hypothetical protein
MNHYQGWPEADSWVAYKNDTELSPKRSQKVRNHSPDGFSWGYYGSGPAQLALAIMLEEFPEAEASRIYQAFKRDHVSTWPMDDRWKINSDQIAEWRRKVDDESKRPTVP